MRRLPVSAAIRTVLLAFPLAFVAMPVSAQTAKDLLTIDTPNDAATLDPHLQWDNDSYGVYRNIFDNLVTRDVNGKIVPQIATAWRSIDDTHMEFDLRTDVKFRGQAIANGGQGECAL